jgi:hypothetical protein
VSQLVESKTLFQARFILILSSQYTSSSYMNNKLFPLLKLTKPSSLMLAAGLVVATVSTGSAQNYVWTGATSSDPTVSTNYSGTPPTYGGADTGTFYIQNGTSGSPLVYTATQGTTTFSGGNIRIGSTSSNGAASGSELDLTGGALTFTSSGTSTIGYNGSGTIGVSGGTLSINGTDQFWFGNTLAATANVSGTGTVNIGDQFLLDRNGTVVNLNLSGGGVFDVTNASGTQYNVNGGSGAATINLGGSSIFEQTGSSAINFSGNLKVNFLTGSLGQFSILNDSTATLDSYITGGYFEINGAVDTTVTDYVVTGAPTTGSQGIIALVPEPSTWAMALVGLGLLVGVQRVRTRKA